MCKKRKYVSYKVIVNKKGGVEEIQFEGINGSSYKNMLDAYRHYISECLTNDIITIDFCGVSSEGKLGIMWTKECKKETDKTPFEVIEDTIDEIKSYKDNYKNYEKWYTKKMDELLHSVEELNFVKYKEEFDKIGSNIINEIFKLRNERREIKYRKYASEKYLSDDTFNLEELITMWNKKSNFKKKDVNKNLKCYRVKYNTKEEKNDLLNKLYEEGWDKIMELPNNYIGYYNVVYSCNKPKESKDVESTTIPTDYIKTVDFNNINLIPKTKGSCVQVRYNNIKDKRTIEKMFGRKYKNIENIQEEKIIRLMYRKTA